MLKNIVESIEKDRLSEAYQLKDVTFDEVDFGNFPLKKKDIVKVIDAFNVVAGFVGQIPFNRIEKMKLIEKEFEKFKDVWRTNIISGIKEAIADWNKK